MAEGPLPYDTILRESGFSDGFFHDEEFLDLEDTPQPGRGKFLRPTYEPVGYLDMKGVVPPDAKQLSDVVEDIRKEQEDATLIELLDREYEKGREVGKEAMKGMILQVIKSL